ncbi:hypothetical protein NUW54_g12613 [Trametes sanguinea]|uniref:Uncharacterized protein n=1 Tax=Trametes sanguinea TaxID=158606 RepID=A0ACC1MXI5_9APHY|nr:hypothetical protein NUW54_g12613 [Trametes sanguinea]
MLYMEGNNMVYVAIIIPPPAPPPPARSPGALLQPSAFQHMQPSFQPRAFDSNRAPSIPTARLRFLPRDLEPSRSAPAPRLRDIEAVQAN